MRILIVIPALVGGGAERVASIMANFWAKRGEEVTLLTMLGAEGPMAYPIEPQVAFRALGIMDANTRISGPIQELFRPSNLTRFRALRAAFRELHPDCIISFLDRINVSTLIAAAGLRVPVIVSERSYPRSMGFLWDRLRDWTYPLAKHVVVQTAQSLDAIPRGSRTNARVIPNPVFPPPPRNSDLPEIPGPFILSVGRLVRQKNHALLLRAFADVAGEFPGWKLVLLGEGPLRAELETLASNLGVSDRVSFPGWRADVYDFHHKADIFAFSSDAEGFPNALAEAMACGRAVISTNCRTGPAELIADGENGFLIPPGDEEAMAEKLRLLMGDAALRERSGATATAVCQRFAPERIMALWDDAVRSNASRSSVDAP